MPDLQVGAVGVQLLVTIIDQDGVVVDISASSARTLYLKRPQPDNRVLAKTATLVGGGTTGQMQYVTVAGDLDVPGQWHIQGKVVNSTGTYPSEVLPLPVFPNLF